jgi:putative hydrolase of the HAD superfamily
MPVRVILLDADGVIQRSRRERRSLWAQLLSGAEAPVDGFLAEVFAHERSCYLGKVDFPGKMADLLARWSCDGSVADALRAWTAIETDRGIHGLIARLRASGRRCYLASNQEPYRARHMSETLGYRSLFDGEFYSCTVGHSKPSADYFKAILGVVGVPADEVLFIDDIPGNVQAACAVGLAASVFAPKQHELWAVHMGDLLAAHGVALESSD